MPLVLMHAAWTISRQMESEPFVGSGTSKGAAGIARFVVLSLAVLALVSAILVLVAGFGDVEDQGLVGVSLGIMMFGGSLAYFANTFRTGELDNGA